MGLLAIDPGNEKSAWVLLRDDVPVEFGISPNGMLLSSLAKVRADQIAIEMVACYGMAVGREVFETCLWIGRFIERWQGDHSLVYRKDVCLHLCHSVRAADPNIRRALIDRYGGQDRAIGGVKCRNCKGKGWVGRGRPTCPECDGAQWLHPPGPLHGITDDVWQALAVGITHLETNRERSCD